VIATHRSVALIQSYILEVIALLLAIILTYLNHYRSRTSSSLLLLFWPAYSAGLLIWARTEWMSHWSAMRIVAILKGVVAGCGLVAFAIECFGSEFSEEDRPEAYGKLEGHVESPLLTANIFSIWTFGWMSSLMKKGAQKYITEDDLPSLVPKDESANLGKRLQESMKKQSVPYLQRLITLFDFITSKNLAVALFAAYGGPYAFAACLKLVQDCFVFLQPQLLRWLLAYISAYQSARPNGIKQRGAPSPFEGFAIAFIMFAAAITQTITLNQVSSLCSSRDQGLMSVYQYFQRCFETGMRVRAGLVTVIYQKALVLSNDGRSSASGDIVNLMSVDAMRLQDFCTYGLIAISGPFQVRLVL
jgi:ATP-binding cassette, subfamily C (CFTR/MRP), member 1